MPAAADASARPPYASSTTIVIWLVRRLYLCARPIGDGRKRFSDAPGSTNAFLTNNVSVSITPVWDAFATAERRGAGLPRRVEARVVDLDQRPLAGLDVVQLHVADLGVALTKPAEIDQIASFTSRGPSRNKVGAVLKPDVAAPGVFYVFRHVTDREAHLARATRRRRYAAPAIPPSVTFDQNRELLEPLLRFMAERGRPPAIGEN